MIFARSVKTMAWWAVRASKEGDHNLCFTHKTITIQQSFATPHACVHT